MIHMTLEKAKTEIAQLGVSICYFVLGGSASRVARTFPDPKVRCRLWKLIFQFWKTKESPQVGFINLGRLDPKILSSLRKNKLSSCICKGKWSICGKKRIKKLSSRVRLCVGKD